MTQKFILSTTLCLMCTLGTQALACTDREAAVAAVNAGDFGLAETLQQNVSVDPACDDAFRLWLDENLARHYFALAQGAQTADAKRTALNQSIGYFPHWRSYAALADLAAAQGDRGEEARLLQVSINQMNDGPEHHSFTQEEAQEMLNRASTAMLLADTVVEPPRTRSGTPGGIFIENLRGFKVKEVALAIEFDFDSATMTEKGAGYAQQLLVHVLERSPEKIVLEGHTDPVGAADYNEALSLKRAEALRDFLVGEGYGGTVDVIGRGESKLPKPGPGITPDSPEHYQAARRVVLIRG
jgi:outer membrane protein OmpA-like peptidoglycan-associated protein